jgi:hypothetical protein
MTPYATELTQEATQIFLTLDKSKLPLAYIERVTRDMIQAINNACNHGRSNLARSAESVLESLIDEMRHAVSRTQPRKNRAMSPLGV